MFCLCLGLPCVFRQGFRAVLFCQNQSGGFRYGESECGGFHGFFPRIGPPIFPYSTILSVFGMTASLKNFTVQPGVRYWMRETYGRGCFYPGSTVCSPYIMRVVCSDIATVTKAQLSAAGFLRGWCAPFASLESGVRTGSRCCLGRLGTLPLRELR